MAIASHLSAAARDTISSTDRAPSENRVWMCVSTFIQTPWLYHGISRTNVAPEFCAATCDHAAATATTPINTQAVFCIRRLFRWRRGCRRCVHLRNDLARDVESRCSPHERVGIQYHVDTPLSRNGGNHRVHLPAELGLRLALNVLILR